MSHVFGPVPSRRLGRSLGIDVVPFKTCSYDCIYCQLGRTTCKTVELTEFVSLESVLEELKEKLATSPDYITLSGSGEPTLYSRLGELVERVKSMTDIPLALLTNGSLLWKPEVRDAIKTVDLLVPSLDAGDQSSFLYVNRPHESITFDLLMEGLIAARQECRGQYWLEVLLLAGCTDHDEQVRKIVECTNRIRPDRIQLNTASRPPAEDYARYIPAGKLAEIASLFDLPVEIIADNPHIDEKGDLRAGKEEILNLLKRRPCSIEGIAQGLGMHSNEVIKYIDAFLRQGLVENTWCDGKQYYRAADK